MFFLKKSNIGIYIIIGVLLGAFVFVSAKILYEYLKNEQISQKHKQINRYLERYVNIIKIHDNANVQKLTTSERVASNFFNENNLIYEDKTETLDIEAIIENTSITNKFAVNKLFCEKQLIYNNTSIPERITHITGGYLSLWQKIDDGYIRISSNLPEAITVGSYPVFIHNSSLIVQNVERGEKYFSHDIQDNELRLSVYKPLYLNKNVKGIIQITINRGLSAQLNKVFLQNEFYSENKAFYLTKDGTSIINTMLSNEFESNDIFHKIKIKDKTFNSLKYKKHERGRYVNEILFFKYIAAIEGYAGISVSEKELTGDLPAIRNGIYVWALVLWALVLSTFIILLKRFSFFKKSITLRITEMSEGYVESYIKFDDENVESAFEKLQDYTHETEGKIKRLTNKEFDRKDDYFLRDAGIGKALMYLQKSYYNVINEQNKLNEESALRRKISQGTLNINSLLQASNDLDTLAFDVLRNIIIFLEVEQGGFFILNEENPDDVFLEMKASYAFDKKRTADKKIPVKDGLIGRSVLEKESIYLTEIPENYTKIASGFGEIEPKSIAITPLIFNKKVHGVIEIASSKEIEEYKIKFVENVGENIASTFSSVRNALKTEQLLKQTQKQATLIETQGAELQERIETHRRQNRNLDKKVVELNEIINSIKTSTYVIEYELNGNIIGINPRITATFDIPDKNIAGMKHRNIIVSKNYRGVYRSLWRDLKSGKPRDFASEIIKINNKQFAFNQIYVPIKNARGRIFRVLAIGHLIE